MIPLGWMVAAGLGLAVACGGAGYFAGKDVQRDADDSRALRAEAEARETSRGDERLISSLTDTIDRVASAALNRADAKAAPIIVGMRDALAPTPLATDPRCAVPDSVRDQADSLHRAAERAADAADRAGEPAAGGTVGPAG